MLMKNKINQKSTIFHLNNGIFIVKLRKKIYPIIKNNFYFENQEIEIYIFIDQILRLVILINQ